MVDIDLSSVPEDATITNVNLSISLSGLQNLTSVSITAPSWTGDAQLYQIYDYIHDGKALFSGKSNGDYQSTSLTNLIKGHLGDKVFLGIYTPQEPQDNSAGSANVILTFDYTEVVVPTTATVVFKTDMDGYAGGKVTVDNTTGTNITKTKNIGQSISAAAYEGSDQQYNTYDWIYNDSEALNRKSEWQVSRGGASYALHTSDASFTRTLEENDDNATYRSVLRKICEVDFDSEFKGVPSMKSTITVTNAFEHVSGLMYKEVEGNKITATTTTVHEDYTKSPGIKYEFYWWEDEEGNVVGGGSSHPFYPYAHKTYIAVMRGTPIFNESYYRNLRNIEKRLGYPIKLQWGDHPNINVTHYRIFRSVHGPQAQTIEPTTQIATVSRGTTTYVDNDYVVGNSSSTIQVYYDVRAYYSIEQTESMPNEIVVNSGVYTPPASKESIESEEDLTGITEFAIGNFPNPFNPTTTVNYQLPYAGMVNITVYDMLGKEVTKLVSAVKESGKYSVQFDGNQLASGTYLLNIQVTPQDANKSAYIETKKMLMLK